MKTFTFTRELGNEVRFDVDFDKMIVTLVRDEGYDLINNCKILTPIASCKILPDRNNGLEAQVFNTCFELAGAVELPRFLTK